MPRPGDCEALRRLCVRISGPTLLGAQHQGPANVYGLQGVFFYFGSVCPSRALKFEEHGPLDPLSPTMQTATCGSVFFSDQAGFERKLPRPRGLRNLGLDSSFRASTTWSQTLGSAQFRASITRGQDYSAGPKLGIPPCSDLHRQAPTCLLPTAMPTPRDMSARMSVQTSVHTGACAPCGGKDHV